MVLAHQGEEFVLILPAVMLVGAFFIMRWANQDEKADGDAADDGVPADPVGAVPSPAGQDVDETTR